MRTTLDIDDDVLAAVKNLAATQKTTIGKVLSDLARRGLPPSRPLALRTRNGLPLLPGRRNRVTAADVAKLLNQH